MKNKNKSLFLIIFSVFCFLFGLLENVFAYTGQVDAQGNCYFYYKTGPSQYYAGIASNVYDYTVTNGTPVTVTYVTMGSYTESQWDVQFRGWKWDGMSWSPAGVQLGPMRVRNSVYQALNTYIGDAAIPQPANTLWPTGPPEGSCVPPNPCDSKQGTVSYNLESHLSNITPSTDPKCYDGCRQTVEILWEDCINDSCVSSMKYIYTGVQCTNEASLADVDSDPPQRCTEQLEQKIAQCGGSLNVQSFNFNDCTGVCAPDDCHAAWLAKVEECGGVMAVSSWNPETCTGRCVNDPVPNKEDPPDGVSPGNIETETKENLDGTRTETTTTSYNYQGTTFTETITTNYDSQGNSTGTSVSRTQKPQNDPVNPGVPDDLVLDTGVGDSQNWTEYDDPAQVAQNRIATETQNYTPSAGSLPLDMNLNISGSPVLSGVMYGKTVEIRFDRPWMQTGYSIMAALLVGIGYLQVFLMINRTIIER